MNTNDIPPNRRLRGPATRAAFRRRADKRAMDAALRRLKAAAIDAALAADAGPASGETK